MKARSSQANPAFPKLSIGQKLHLKNFSTFLTALLEYFNRSEGLGNAWAQVVTDENKCILHAYGGLLVLSYLFEND